MDNLAWIVIVFGLGALVGATAFWLVAGPARAGAARADEAAEHRLRLTAALMAPVKESLERLNTRLIEVEKQRVAMTTELRGQVSAVRATGEQLRRETNALVTALRKPQVRGSWGELQLRRVAETAGMLEHCDFVQQATATSAEGATIRPDMKILFSDSTFVYVDAKTPLTGFLDACEADDEAEQQAALKRFAANVRAHVDQLSRKGYFTADTGTPEFVVLFLPSEALGAEAFAQLPDLFEYATARDIVIATPTTLIAILRSIAYSWKQAALADSAREVFALGRELYSRLGKLGTHFDRLGRSLAGAVSAYNDAVGCAEARVLTTARRFRDLGIAEAELERPRRQDVTVRSLSAPELIEDAAGASPEQAWGSDGQSRAISMVS